MGNPSTIFGADGTNFPDALSGGVVGLGHGPLILAPKTGQVSTGTIAFLTAIGQSAADAWLFGGEASIDDGVFTEVSDALTSPTTWEHGPRRPRIR